MKKNTLPKPTTPDEAIRAVMYLRGWRHVNQLAAAIGADQSWLCKALNHGRGSQKLVERILAQAPENVTWI